MLAVEKGVIAGLIFGIEDGVAVVVPIAVAAGQVELLLNGAVIAPVHIIFVISTLFSKKGIGDMLHRIEAETIGTRLVDKPTHRTIKHAIDILLDRIAHVINAIAEAEGCRLTPRHRGIDSRIREGLGGLTQIVLSI